MTGESYDAAQDDPDSKFGPMKRGDVVKNFVPNAPIKFGSAYYKKPTSEQAPPVYVENINRGLRPTPQDTNGPGLRLKR